MPRTRRTAPHGHTRASGSTGLFVLLVASLLCVARRAQGEVADPFELSPEQLFSATVVSATRTRDTWWDTPAAAFVLTSSDIARSGATSIPEVLRLVPGVNVARRNNSSWAISVRGFNSDLSNKLLVLIDGREVYNSLFSGVYWDVQDTALEDIERIEVIRGPGATLWGANAVDGIVNIITKNAAQTQGALVSALGGNEEAVAMLRYGGAAPGEGHYRVFGKYLWRDDQRSASGDEGRDAWQAGRGGFRADWGADPGHPAFTLQGDGYYSRADHLRSVPLLTAPYARTEEATLVATGADLLGRWIHQLEGGSRLSLQGYVDYTARNTELLDEDFVAADLDAQYEAAPWRFLDLVIGARYRYSFDQLGGSPQVSFPSSQRNDHLYSGFLQGKLTLLPGALFLTLGTKLEENDYSGFEVQPGARLQWHPDDRNMLWASVARAVRRPSRLEHDVDVQLATLPPSAAVPAPVSVVLRNNSGFDSEELIAYELGYRSRWHRSLLFDVAAFYNDYDELATNSLLEPSIVNNGVDPLYVLLPVTITNDTRGQAYGVEAVLSWHVLEPLQLSAAYSYLRIELDGPPSDVAIESESAEDESPHHQLTLRGQWNLSEDLSLDATVYYVDALPVFDVKDYWRLDLRLAWKVCDDWELDLVGQNLLQHARREFASPTDVAATAPQRAGYLRVKWSF